MRTICGVLLLALPVLFTGCARFYDDTGEGWSNDGRGRTAGPPDDMVGTDEHGRRYVDVTPFDVIDALGGTDAPR